MNNWLNPLFKEYKRRIVYFANIDYDGAIAEIDSLYETTFKMYRLMNETRALNGKRKAETNSSKLLKLLMDLSFEIKSQKLQNQQNIQGGN